MFQLRISQPSYSLGFTSSVPLVFHVVELGVPVFEPTSSDSEMDSPPSHDAAVVFASHNDGDTADVYSSDDAVSLATESERGSDVRFSC